jgi:hypothetical protein
MFSFDYEINQKFNNYKNENKSPLKDMRYEFFVKGSNDFQQRNKSPSINALNNVRKSISVLTQPNKNSVLNNMIQNNNNKREKFTKSNYFSNSSSVTNITNNTLLTATSASGFNNITEYTNTYEKFSSVLSCNNIHNNPISRQSTSKLINKINSPFISDTNKHKLNELCRVNTEFNKVGGNKNNRSNSGKDKLKSLNYFTTPSSNRVSEEGNYFSKNINLQIMNSNNNQTTEKKKELLNYIQNDHLKVLSKSPRKSKQLFTNISNKDIFKQPKKHNALLNEIAMRKVEKKKDFYNLNPSYSSSVKNDNFMKNRIEKLKNKLEF